MAVPIYLGKRRIHCTTRPSFKRTFRLWPSINSTGPSSIKYHVNKTGYKASTDDLSIISKANNPFDLLIYESLLIHRDRQSHNFQQSSIPMSLFSNSPIWCLLAFSFVLISIFFPLISHIACYLFMIFLYILFSVILSFSWPWL